MAARHSLAIRRELGDAMKEMHVSIIKARNDLEHQSIEGLVGGAQGSEGSVLPIHFAHSIGIRHLFFFFYSYHVLPRSLL